MPPLKRIKGRYEIKAVLGEGGMGVVYRAYDPPPMARDVALKTLLEFPDRMSLQLFYKECEVLKSMSHPNIVEIFDIGEFDDGGTKKPFFVMPLLQGQPLDALIREGSHRLTVERVVDIISQTCRGLQAAHDRGLVHRDLKPSNLFVIQDDSVKIIDFGVAHRVDSRTRSSGFQKGTLLYMAPEQLQLKPVSPQSDIFSLGVVCYEALTRRNPFRAAAEEDIIDAIMKRIPPPASEINPAVSQTISRVIHKAMAKQPWNRFDSAREFGETLQKALRNEPIEIFDPARIQPRIQRAAKALDNGDYQFANEIVGELEAEGNIDPQLSLLRAQIDQVVRLRTISQLLESARARYEEEEDPLALQKIQEILQLDANNVAALGLKSRIEERRSQRQFEKWLRLARQHIDNHAYSHAREALHNVTQLRANEPRALRLLSEIENEEKKYLQLRQQKAQVYQSALNAYKNGEVSEALTQMGLVLELDLEAPDTSSPETNATYQNFYNKVRSEHDAINNAYAEARRLLASRDYAKALKICQDALAKYPNQALFQALKFDVEEQQRQQLSAFIAEIDRKLEAEADLDAKVNLLREALASYQGEAHFERSLRIISDKRDLVNSIVARSRAHEEKGQINEALSDLEILRTIYSPYPGLQFEIERLQKRREQQARDSTKARWVEQVDRQLETGNYSRSLELLQKALAEFPDDVGLIELEKLALQGQDRAAKAEQLLAHGRELCQQGRFDEGLEAFIKARQLDDRNPVILAALRDVLMERAENVMGTDWRAADAFAAQVLELDPNHALARSIRSQAQDRKREEEVGQYASRARRLQAAGELESAEAEVEKGLDAYPSEPRLSVIRDTLNKEISQVQRRKSRLRDLEQARELRQEAAALPDSDRLTSIYERSQVYAEKYPDEPELQTIAREVQRIVKARGERPPTTEPKPRFSLSATLGPLLSPPVLIASGSVACLLIVGLTLWRFWPLHPKPSPPVVHVEIRTVPPGASLRINGQDRGTSGGQIDLQPGNYQVEAILPGYQASTAPLSVQAGAPRTLELTLAPSPQRVSIAAPDLVNGQVWLDDNQVGGFDSGALTLPNISAGPHVLRIAAQKSGEDATIQFQIAPNYPPVLSTSVSTHQLQVVAVSTGAGTAQVISSSLSGAQVTVDDKPTGQLGPDGLQIGGLTQGVHELVLVGGSAARKMSFEIDASPGLDAIVYSDRDVGSMLIVTGEDNVEVFLDGKPYRRKTQHGQLRIPNLETTRHTVHVHKDGFQDPSDQSTRIAKGQETNLRFTLEALPKLASLLLDHIPPGAQVTLDDAPLGTVGADGTLSRTSIAAGQHSLRFVLPGAPPKRIDRKFGPGEMVRLSNADLDLKRAQTILEIVTIDNMSVTVLQSGRTIHQFIGSSKLALDEGTYTVTGRAPNGASVSSSVVLAAGKTSTLNLRAADPRMERWDHPEAWTLQDGWYVRRGGDFVLYDAPPGPCNYVFALGLPHGHNPFSQGPRTRWVVAYLDSRNYILMQLDSKFLYRTEVVNGTKHDLPKVAHRIPDSAPFVTLSLDVAPNTLLQRYTLLNGQWQILDFWDRGKVPSLFQDKSRSFTNGKFGFLLPKDSGIAISNFAFYPKR